MIPPVPVWLGEAAWPVLVLNCTLSWTGAFSGWREAPRHSLVQRVTSSQPRFQREDGAEERERGPCEAEPQ